MASLSPVIYQVNPAKLVIQSETVDWQGEKAQNMGWLQNGRDWELTPKVAPNEQGRANTASWSWLKLKWIGWERRRDCSFSGRDMFYFASSCWPGRVENPAEESLHGLGGRIIEHCRLTICIWWDGQASHYIQILNLKPWEQGLE